MEPSAPVVLIAEGEEVTNTSPGPSPVLVFQKGSDAYRNLEINENQAIGTCWGHIGQLFSMPVSGAVQWIHVVGADGKVVHPAWSAFGRASSNVSGTFLSNREGLPTRKRPDREEGVVQGWRGEKYGLRQVEGGTRFRGEDHNTAGAANP